MLNDAQWALLEPLIEACRPKGKTPQQDLRRTLSAILWRHQNGAKWRAIRGCSSDCLAVKASATIRCLVPCRRTSATASSHSRN